jgi:hypothetical protein
MSAILHRMVRRLGRVAATVVLTTVALVSMQNGLAAFFHSASPLGYQEALIVALLVYGYIALRFQLRLSLQRKIARARRD